MAKDYLPSNWHVPDDFTFSPINGNDEFDIKCLDQIIDSKNSRICGFLQRHVDIIMVIRVLIEEETLTMTELESTSVMKRFALEKFSVTMASVCCDP